MTKNTKTITTTISKAQFSLAIDKKWKWSEIIKAGIGSLVAPEIRYEMMQNEIIDLKKKLSDSRRKKIPLFFSKPLTDQEIQEKSQKRLREMGIFK